MGIAPEPADILRFALAARDAGRRAAIVTLTGIEGSSSRALGSQMAVDEDGASCGSFSAGCIDAATVAEAGEAIARSHGRLLRFGAGSPFVDVRLPCGGGIDLLITPVVDAEPVRLGLSALDRREPASLRFTETEVAAAHDGATAWRRGAFHRTYHPRMRIVVLGRGDELVALAALARSFGGETVAIAPHPGPPGLHELCDTVIEPRTLSETLPQLGDRWTGFVSLLHDGDWEAALLPRILRQEGFFHGAVGSCRHHASRRSTLARSGVSRHDLDRLRGQIGLIPSTRDPATLAISVLAEMVAEYRQCACAPQADGSMVGALMHERC